MKKIIINTIAIFALVVSVFLQTAISNNTYAFVSCDGVTSSSARSKCTSMVAACEKQTSQAKDACEAQVQKKINACINVPDTSSQQQCFNAQFGTSSSSTTPTDNPTNDDPDGGGTSGTAGSSKSTNGATQSSPDEMKKTCKGENQVQTSILGGGGCIEIDQNGGNIFKILNTILTILTYGVGIAGTLGIVISGIQYLTAKDNEQQMVKAKSRLINIVIGLAAYAFMWAFLQWLIPGGLLNGGN